MIKRYYIRFCDTGGYYDHEDCEICETLKPEYSFSSIECAEQFIETEWILQRGAAGRQVEIVTVYTVPEESED